MIMTIIVMILAIVVRTKIHSYRSFDFVSLTNLEVQGSLAIVTAPLPLDQRAGSWQQSVVSYSEGQ